MDFVKICKYNFNKGYYTATDVAVFVFKGKITPEDYQSITGQTYVA